MKTNPYAIEVIINGSYVTSKECPEDIDLLLILSKDTSSLGTINPFIYNTMSRRITRRRYGFDIFQIFKDSDDYEKMIDYFRQVKNNPQIKKGLLRIKL